MHYLNAGMTEAQIRQKMEVHQAGGTYHGGTKPGDGIYFEDCKHFLPWLKTLLTYTRDVGYCEGNDPFWTVPELNICMHLSVSFTSGEATFPKDIPETRRWVNALYGRFKARVWCQRPWSEVGKAAGVWHYHLFLKDDLKKPQVILPKMATVLTEAGFVSWPELEKEHDQILSEQEPADAEDDNGS